LCRQSVLIGAVFAAQTGIMRRIWQRYSLHLLLLAAIVFMAMPALFAFADR